MGVPGGRAECLTPSGRRQWQPLDSPLWQAAPYSSSSAVAVDVATNQVPWQPDFLSLATAPLSRYPLGSDAWLSRPSSARTTSSRPRTAGSAAAALEAAKAAGEAAKAAADAAMVAARLICQDEELPSIAPEVEILELPSGNSRPSSPQLEESDRASFLRSLEAWKTEAEEECTRRSPWSKMQQSFIRSLARPSEDLTALDALMSSTATRPPAGVFPNVVGRWNLPPDRALQAPKARIPDFPAAAGTQEEAAALGSGGLSGLYPDSVEDFMADLDKARDAFEVIVSLSPGLPQRRVEVQPLPIASTAPARESLEELPDEGVSFATDKDLELTWLDWKGWGMAPNNVWWASDSQRPPLAAAQAPPSRGSSASRSSRQQD
eukprot:s576_g8.t1